MDPVGPDEFVHPGREDLRGWPGMFGGQPLAVGLRAAGQTVGPGRVPHSLHAYFLRRGSMGEDMEIAVERDTDGRSFSGRRVTVTQAGKLIFTMSASFHVPEDGPVIQEDRMPPGVPDPEEIETAERPGPRVVEVRNVDSRNESTMPARAWARAAGSMPEDPLLHACVLVHFSDLYTGMPAFPGTDYSGGPSLDHSFWFLQVPRLDDWVLMDLRPVAAGNGRGLYAGSFFDRQGTIIGALTQEVLYSTSRDVPQLLPGMDPAEKQPPPHRR